jgi:altronate dehydratase small subunit
MAGRSKAIIINEKDNVATAIVPLKKGSVVSLERQGRAEKVQIVSPIPMGHKFALQDIEKGTDLMKYGEPIGYATAPIARGAHVHVHNVASHRGKKKEA